MTAVVGPSGCALCGQLARGDLFGEVGYRFVCGTCIREATAYGTEVARLEKYVTPGDKVLRLVPGAEPRRLRWEDR